MGVYNIRVTDRNGTVLQSLVTSSAGRVLEYLPASPEPEAERLPNTGDAGAVIVAVNRPNAIDAARYVVLDSTSTAQTVARNLEAIFRRAAHHQARPQDAAGPIYWELEVTPGAGYWRSELKRGHVELEPGALSWGYSGKAMVLRLLVEREPVFHGPLTAVPLSNGNGTNTTSALTVWNHDDGGAGHDSYVAIGSSGVTGALPTPAEIGITNVTATDRTYDVFVGANAWGDPATFNPVIEAESLTPFTTSAVLTGSSYSNNQARSLSWSGSAETVLATATLSSAQLAACAGGYFRLFARFTANPAGDTWLRANLLLFGLTRLWEGEQVLLETNQHLQDLGVFPLPPYLPGESGLNDLTLQLTGYATAGGSKAITVDYLYWMPLRSYRHYRPKGYGLAQSARILEQANGVIRSDGWAGGAIGHYIGYGGPLWLWPGRAQRLHILQRADDGTAAIDRQLAVQVWHRPRRLTL